MKFGFSMPSVAPLYPEPPYTYKSNQAMNILFRTSPEILQELVMALLLANPDGLYSYRLFFQGEHSFIIEPIEDNKMRYIDQEFFKGLLVPLRAKDFDTNSKRGFEEMDKALS